jgi:Ca2+-transporting ATPase
LKVDHAAGVPSHEIEQRRDVLGANVLVREAGRPGWRIFLAQFTNIIVVLLLVAAVVAFVTRDAAEGLAILAVLVINALIGFFVEWASERALRKLRLQTRTSAHVVRDGRDAMIDAEELVAGDVIVLEAGAHVPADARLLESSSLQVEESALTGESVPVSKHPNPVEHDASIPDRTSMVHLGTSATAGHARAIVTAVGERTELGNIGRLVRESKDEKTPLERQLDVLGRRLVQLVLIVAAIVIITGILRGQQLWEMVEVGISLAVAAVPEGLPAVTTLILAIGVLRMARRNAIVRRLPAVETLGSTTVICTDKTGTLTMNRLTVRVIDAQDRARLLRAAVLCNDATETTGDPTEVALVVAARNEGIDVDSLRNEHPRVAEEPFSSETKRMITTHETPDGTRIELLKGGPGAVLDLCEGPSASLRAGVDREQVNRRNDELAAEALRVLAFADKSAEANRFTFLGLVGMDDPPRPGALEAIEAAHRAGVRVVMLTGDQLATARAITKELRIAGDREPNVVKLPTNAEWKDVDAFARVSPEDKLTIVAKLREAGDIVAVTGDGVNDAPALRRADIGVAMGKSGTDVAKQSSDLILADDNLATIVSAIEQGRTIYANIRKFVHLMFSHNLGEVLTVFVAIASGMPLPLLPLQILWINLVTDVFPAFGLAMEPASRESMRQPSRSQLLHRDFLILIGWQGVMLAAITLGAYVWALDRYGEGAHARTIALFTLVSVQIGHTFNCRSRTASAFRDAHRNPYLWSALVVVFGLQLFAYHFAPLARLLGVSRLVPADHLVLAICAAAPIVIVEAQKLVIRWRR